MLQVLEEEMERGIAQNHINRNAFNSSKQRHATAPAARRQVASITSSLDLHACVDPDWLHDHRRTRSTCAVTASKGWSLKKRSTRSTGSSTCSEPPPCSSQSFVAARHSVVGANQPRRPENNLASTTAATTSRERGGMLMDVDRLATMSDEGIRSHEFEFGITDSAQIDSHV
jgi:hypothetical protein